jgi:MFS family permease
MLNRQYWRLWAAATISNLGDGVTLAAMPLLAATLTRSPSKVALVALFVTLPWLLFALIGGALADRFDRRVLMGTADLFRMVAIGGVGVAVLGSAESLALLCVISFLLGSAECVFDNASQAILPMIVDRDGLEKANGRLYAAEIVTNEFAGPPLGAALFAAAASVPFLFDAASFGLAALLVLTLRGVFRPQRTVAATMRADIGEGVRWLRDHTLLRTLAIALGVMNLFGTAMISILVLYALEVLKLSATGYGLLLSAGAVGGLIGSLTGSWISARLGAGRTLLVAATVFGLGALVPAVWANTFAVGASFALSAAFGTIWNIITVSMRQTIVPEELLGRVNSAYRLLGWGTMPIGAAVGGLLADGFGLRAPFLVAGILSTVLVLAMAPTVNNRTVASARAAAG